MRQRLAGVLDWIERRRVLVGVALPVLALVAATSIRIANRPARDFDERMFLSVGQHIADIGLPITSYPVSRAGFFFDHTPLYSYFVGLLTALPGPVVLLARGASLGFALLTVTMVFLIGYRLRGAAAGFIGAMLLALTPFFVTYAWFVRMEVPLVFFLVLALYLLIAERFLAAGLSIAVAVMLKEIALGFWLVALVYVAVRSGRRAAAKVALPAPIAVAAWFAYAASLDLHALLVQLQRWGRSSVGDEPGNRRFAIDALDWANRIFVLVVGPLLTFAAGVAAAIATLWPSRIPRIVIVPVAYMALAVGASFVMSLKEPRFLIGIPPMLAITIALGIDWAAVCARMRPGGYSAPRTTSRISSP